MTLKWANSRSWTKPYLALLANRVKKTCQSYRYQLWMTGLPLQKGGSALSSSSGFHRLLNPDWHRFAPTGTLIHCSSMQSNQQNYSTTSSPNHNRTLSLFDAFTKANGCWVGSCWPLWFIILNLPFHWNRFGVGPNFHLTYYVTKIQCCAQFTTLQWSTQSASSQ